MSPILVSFKDCQGATDVEDAITHCIGDEYDDYPFVTTEAVTVEYVLALAEACPDKF